MFKIISKILFLDSKKYLAFLFISVFLSLFSYIFWNNIIWSVNNYLSQEIKPIVWWDIVLSSRNKLMDESVLDKYKDDFYIAKTIEIYSSIFDWDNNPKLYKLIYKTDNYPIYWDLEMMEINPNWKILVDKQTYEILWDEVEIFWEKFFIKSIITKNILSEIWWFNNDNFVYIPIEYFDSNLNSSNSRIDYKYYFAFKDKENLSLLEDIKNDPNLKNFRKRTIQDGDSNINNITDRFYLFINFFNLVIFVLSFFIVILSFETFFKKVKYKFGILNIFWISYKKLFSYVFLFFLLCFLVFFIFWVLTNYIIFELLKQKYEFLWVIQSEIIKWFLVALILLFVWIFSPFYKVYKEDLSQTLKWNTDFSNFKILDYIIYLSLIFIWFLLISLISWIWFLYSILYSFIFVFIIFIFYIIINSLLKINFVLLFSKIKNFYIFDSIRSTIKPWNVSFLIVFSSIISFLWVFVFYVFSSSFLYYLKNITNLSNDMFVINIQTKDIPTIEKYFNQDEIYEIVNLRIKKINWKTLQEHLDISNPWREFTREFFSTTKTLDNRIVKWSKLSKWWVSIDVDIANRLWVNLWDIIIFWVSGIDIELNVDNFREAVRNWTDPFFFFMVDKSDFEKYPKSYILSYKSSSKDDNLANMLIDEIWPHLSFINTKEIIDIVIDIANQVLLVVYICLFYIFIFSFLSFLVSINFLTEFKISKIKTLNILWWDIKKLVFWFKFEYNYLIFLWFIISIILGSIWLILIFYFIDYFSLNIISYIMWIGIVFCFLLIFIISLLLKKVKIN